MDIPISLINYYLGQITVGYFDDHDLPPGTVSGYEDELANLETIALRNKEDEMLRLGLEHILADPDFDCRRINGGRYPFTNDQIREIIAYVRQMLWPGAGPIPPGGPPDVRLVPMGLEQWRQSRKS
jgi:hypothetical protein